ncbi:serine/threonine-protein kinase [Spirillospora sp. NBC_01491]|uniref:serine/threonine-protein kinase n=1 Tax=Spirillospora sp. NBC_01491 TaxID=2976007 RepID=UPI002E2ED739|nr:protein kinase [Spirillospora sp. NBC_01491]
MPNETSGERLLARRYRLVTQVGRGGMGTVWQAHDEVLGRDVAVKEVILPHGLTDEERAVQYKRTFREARTAARLGHPGVVTVYDVVEEDGRPWIIMELIRARSLDQVIKQEGPLEIRRAADIGRQMLAALHAAHDAGVLHRDVKPSNVLVTRGDRAVLTDFGIATASGDATLTQTGLVMGSPAYIAPERARGRTAGPASDLWSLGVTLFAMVHGRSPFERAEPMAALVAVISEDPDPPEKAGRLAPVIEGLLAKNPDHRMEAIQAGALLDEIVRHESVDTQRTLAVEVSLEQLMGQASPGAGAPPAEQERPAKRLRPARRERPKDQPQAQGPPPAAKEPTQSTEPHSAVDEEAEEAEAAYAKENPPPSAQPRPKPQPKPRPQPEPQPQPRSRPEPPPPAAPAPAPDPTDGRTRSVPTLGDTASVAPGPARAPSWSPGPATGPTGHQDPPATGPAGHPALARNRNALLVAVAVVILLVVVAAVAWANSGGGGAEKKDPPVGQKASSAPPPSSSSPPATPTQTVSSSPGLPAGFHMHKDRTGYWVPIPDGWSAPKRKDGGDFFYSPDESSYIQIGQTSTPGASALRDWEQQENGGRAFRGYKLVKMAKTGDQPPVPDTKDGAKSADWEFTHTTSRGRMRILNRGFVANGHGYAILLSAPNGGWDKTFTDLQPVYRFFKPAGA